MDTKDKLTAMYLSYTGYALFVVIGLYCVYLSWTTNGRYGTGLVMKIVYAVCAYFANVAYLVFYYVFYIWGQLKVDMEGKKAAYEQITENAKTYSPSEEYAKRFSTGSL